MGVSVSRARTALFCAIAVQGSDVYVGGRFSSINGINVTNIAKWDGTDWKSLGGGIRGRSFPNVLGLAASSGDSLYVGGIFSQAGDTPASNIARWDGTNWWPLGPGVNGIVRALAADGENLYVAGSISVLGQPGTVNIARWNG